LISQQQPDLSWVYDPIAGNEDPFVGAYGFYASAKYDGADAVVSNWVIDQPEDQNWVEVHRRTIGVE
jgi:hypothetical protein